MSFQVGLQSIDGEVNQIISAKTSQKICGGMKSINWRRQSRIADYDKRSWRRCRQTKRNARSPEIAGDRTDREGGLREKLSHWVP